MATPRPRKPLSRRHKESISATQKERYRLQREAIERDRRVQEQLRTQGVVVNETQAGVR